MMVCRLGNVWEKSLLEGPDSKLSSSVSGDYLYIFLFGVILLVWCFPIFTEDYIGIIGQNYAYLKWLYCYFRQVLFEVSHYIFHWITSWYCDCYFWNSSFHLSSDNLLFSNRCFIFKHYFFLLNISWKNIVITYSELLFYLKQQHSNVGFIVWLMT